MTTFHITTVEELNRALHEHPDWTIAELTRVLLANPEWREELQRALLTQELLALPQLFAEYTKVTDARLTALEETTAALVLHAETTNRRLDIMDARLDGIDARLEDVDTRLQDLTNTVNDLRGQALENKARTDVPRLLYAEFSVRNIRVVWHAQTAVTNTRTQEFEDHITMAADNGTISEAEEVRLSVTDLIVRSRRAEEDGGGEMWFTVEISGVIDASDINRTVASAEALKVLYQNVEAVVPVVYGYQISDQDRESAQSAGVQVLIA